jgi:hypothetical protein
LQNYLFYAQILSNGKFRAKNVWMLEHKEKMCPMMPTQTFNKPLFCPIKFYSVKSHNFGILLTAILFILSSPAFMPKIGKSASQTSAGRGNSRNRKKPQK